MAELSISKLLRNPVNLNMLRILNILCLDKVGKISAKTFSALDILLRRICDNIIFLSDLLVVAIMGHTQLPPMKSRIFLLPYHAISCIIVM